MVENIPKIVLYLGAITFPSVFIIGSMLAMVSDLHLRLIIYVFFLITFSNVILIYLGRIGTAIAVQALFGLYICVSAFTYYYNRLNGDELLNYISITCATLLVLPVTLMLAAKKFLFRDSSLN